MKALIQLEPPEIVRMYPETPPDLRLPNGDIVAGPQPGWSNGTFSLVDVPPFTAPAGQVTTGAPRYAMADGAMTETYDTIPAPPPVVTSLAFRKLFTISEQAAITTAGQGDVQIRIFMDDASAAGSVDLGSAELQQGMGYLVNKGLLTQERAAMILSGTLV